MINPGSFSSIAFYILLLIALLNYAYYLYRRFKNRNAESPLAAAELGQQQVQHAPATQSSHRPSTRQLINQSLMQGWRMGDSITIPSSDKDDVTATLRNQRLALMKDSFIYKLIEEDEKEEGRDTSCMVENDSPQEDVECGEEKRHPETSLSTFETIKECPICLDTYTKGEKLAIPISDGCSHAFHDECITLWLLQHNDCPLCRTRLLDVPVQ
jgi:hypothetical protein